MADVSIIIPQHEQIDLTAQAVNSLLLHHPSAVEIVVVDDGSSLCSWRRLREMLLPGSAAQSDKVLLVRRPVWGGVTKAWNAGATASRGELLVFLNNDTLTSGPWVDQLIAPLREGCCEMAGMAWRREKQFPASLSNCAMPSCMLEGWAFALRRATLRQLGGFDKRLTLYYSDTDLQCRLLRDSRMETPLLAVPGLSLQHLGHRTTRQLTTRAKCYEADRQRFLKKWTSQQRVFQSLSAGTR